MLYLFSQRVSLTICLYLEMCNIGGKPVTKRDELRGVRGSEERLDASDPQKPPPMNYSATSTITFFLFTLLVSGPGQPLSLKGDEGIRPALIPPPFFSIIFIYRIFGA